MTGEVDIHNWRDPPLSV